MDPFSTWAPVQSFALRADGYGLDCTKDGATLGGVPLLDTRTSPYGRRSFTPRPKGEIAILLRHAYGWRFDAERRLSGLKVVACALNDGNVVKAIIAALHLALPDLDSAARERLFAGERLNKFNFDPNQPRVPAGNAEGGQWTGTGGGGVRVTPMVHTVRPPAGARPTRVHPAMVSRDPNDPLGRGRSVLEGGGTVGGGGGGGGRGGGGRGTNPAPSGNRPANSPTPSESTGAPRQRVPLDDIPGQPRPRASDAPGERPALQRIHPDSTYERDRKAKESFEFWREQPIEVIVESLKPGNPKQSLTIKPDGRIVQGNTRIRVLEERGFDINKLPYEIHDDASGILFP